MGEEEDISAADLAALAQFLGADAAPAAPAPAAPAAPAPAEEAVAETSWQPWSTVAASNVAAAAAAGALEVSSDALSRPPGFENGPDTGSRPATTNGGDHGGLVGESRSIVLVEQEDPTAQYLAATSWEELSLPKEILDGIFEMGFVRPSKIQEWALPIALKDGNIIGQAQNGSGKTAAFALSMLVKADLSYDCMSGVCVCPTRELAVQNHDVVEKLGKFTGVKTFLAIPQQQRAPRQVSAQIVVGTPGKLQDLIKKRIIDGRWCRIFVVDEADVMIDDDNSMGPQVMQIRAMLPEEMQILLFSATWPDHVERFAKSMVPRANHIKVEKEDLTLATITQTYINVGDDKSRKFQQLCDLYAALNVGQSIIFVNTRVMAFELAKRMKEEGHTVSLICGTQTSGEERIDITCRDRIMGEFRTGVTKVLIATDVLSRGIDVPAVTLVVNYDLPQADRRGKVHMETYMHRIGRTGRFGLRGIAVSLVSDWDMQLLDSIRSFYNCSISRLSGDCEEIEALLKSLR